ncbi:MAG: hypothetical protein JW987_12505 [Anaerolineaceae bacterium]|nr:hypothetical protein [Anaerolineaceae bacterium]
MTDVCRYAITILGTVTEEDLNTTSPLAVTVAEVANDRTQVTLLSDQAGMVGVIRHLHGLGLILLSIDRTPAL